MIITNYLTPSQTAQAAALEGVCKKYDSLKGSIFLSNELNFDPELPCFYLLFHPDREEELIAFLSIFAPSPTEAEIYACTAPSYRQLGCFNTLLEAALHTLKDYGIADVLFVHEPSADSAHAVLDTMEAVFQYSEYLMTLPAAGILPNADLSDRQFPDCHGLRDGLVMLPASGQDLEAMAELHAAAFCEPPEASRQFLSHVFASGAHSRKLTDTEGTLLGICFFSIGRDALSVFSVAIHPDFCRRGYAFQMLWNLISELKTAYPQKPITLEVNSSNQAAFMLYQKLGFQISTQFDYSYADTIELLNLF